MLSQGPSQSEILIQELLVAFLFLVHGLSPLPAEAQVVDGGMVREPANGRHVAPTLLQRLADLILREDGDPRELLGG